MAGLRLAALLLLSCASALEQNIIFTSFGPFDAGKLTTIEYARLSHPLARLFVAVHNYTDDSFFGRPPKVWHHTPQEDGVLAALGATLVLVQPDETPRHAALYRNYRHGSDAPVVYERFCLQRFITLAHVMQVHALSSGLFIDSDVMLFSNMFEAFGDGDWGMGSWTSSWTVARRAAPGTRPVRRGSRSLNSADAFAQYVADFFRRARGRVRSVGVDLTHSPSVRSQRRPCARRGVARASRPHGAAEASVLEQAGRAAPALVAARQSRAALLHHRQARL